MSRATTSWNLVRCLLFLLSAVALYPQGRFPRIVTVKIAVDEEFCVQDTGHLSLCKEIRKSFLHFDGSFDIHFKIKELVYWKPKTTKKHILYFLNDLRKNVKRDPRDLVIGIISPGRLTGGPAGMASYFDGYILVTEKKPRYSLEFLITHELCHIFGAVDLNEKDTIMAIQDPSFKFDEFTRHIIVIQKYRSFSPSSFPLSRNELDEAISLYKQRTELRLEEPGVYFRLAILYLEKEDYDSALSTCYALLKSNPDREGLHTILGNIYLGQNDSDKAIDEFQKELTLSPDLPEIHCNLGLAYAQKAMNDNAAEQYKLALRIDPNYVKAHDNLGDLYLKEGNIEQSIDEYRAVLAICSEIPEALCSLGAALIHKHESELSFGQSGARLGGNPDLNRRAETQEADNAIEEAVGLCKKSISLEPNVPEAHNILGVVYAYQKKDKEAEGEFLKALEFDPDSLQAHFNLGLLYFTLGAAEKAAFHLKKIIEINPSSELSNWILSQVFQTQKARSVALKNVGK